MIAGDRIIPRNASNVFRSPAKAPLNIVQKNTLTIENTVTISEILVPFLFETYFPIGSTPSDDTDDL
ncbi:MAG: hypothetical protein DRP42_00810 [Tenericutes bacterium]|nr:MAG: hypothetical protein DRP42_00810 [Mycoplasmatota bacterium]